MTTLVDVEAAAARIRPFVHRTPVLTSATLDREFDARLFAKCENLQKCGAFKARGACNAVFALPEALAAHGVITHSSGNHGAALAYAAGRRGIPCTVVMPDTAPAVKVAAVRGYGATVHFCPAAQRDATCAALQAESGAVLVHPFENAHVIAGQGTAVLELIQEVPDLDVVVVPVGGGGLCAGSAVVVRSLLPAAAMLGAEPLAVDDAARSLATGVRQGRVVGATSMADGLLTGLGAPNFELLVRHRVRIVTCDEPAIALACRFFAERMKLVVEPSGAVPLAALRSIATELRGKRVGMVLSGGNTDFAWLR
ncbi:MAG: pyridoxal-phosphate dependent enzyme [Planctomycetes bacterium]|nr:pyridoxal-phosphate dependent enzyme [Planctomycetota bacterium]